MMISWRELIMIEIFMFSRDAARWVLTSSEASPLSKIGRVCRRNGGTSNQQKCTRKIIFISHLNQSERLPRQNVRSGFWRYKDACLKIDPNARAGKPTFKWSLPIPNSQSNKKLMKMWSLTIWEIMKKPNRQRCSWRLGKWLNSQIVNTIIGMASDQR